MGYTEIAQRAPQVYRANRMKQVVIGPDDADDLISLVADCSPENRALRFHTGMAQLRPTMAHQLADLDPEDGVALGLRTRRGKLIADARYTRIAPQVAEAAVLVADRYHRRGLGESLLASVFQRAADDGVTSIHAHVLPSNEAALDLMAKLAPVHDVGFSDGARQLCMPLTAAGCAVCQPAALSA